MTFRGAIPFCFDFETPIEIANLVKVSIISLLSCCDLIKLNLRNYGKSFSAVQVGLLPVHVLQNNTSKVAKITREIDPNENGVTLSVVRNYAF